MAEMKWTVMYISSFLFVCGWVWVYFKMIANKSPKTGIIYGLVTGLAHGISFGYGCYATMPIPYMLALGWFLSSAVVLTIAGWIMGMIIKE